MVGWKKFLIIPVIVLIYIIAIDIVANVSSSVIQTPTTAQKGSSPGALNIGVGEGISVYVTRPYLFGLIRLPVYAGSLGNIAIFHDIFFFFIMALIVFFILIEKFPKEHKMKFQGGDYKMKTGVFQFDWKKLLRSLALGLGIGMLSFILSADGGPSVALGLLVIYLEYKFK